jgi:hypothetical protein
MRKNRVYTVTLLARMPFPRSRLMHFTECAGQKQLYKAGKAKSGNPGP